jgi:predicted thioesterase
MKEGAKPGLEHDLVRVVTRDLSVLATRTPPVFATAEMIRLMEYAAYQVLEPFYEDHESSVGVRIEVEHLAPTPLGMRVRATARLVRTEGRRYFFELTAYDEKEQIGRGTHERFVIEADRFANRLNSKLL